MEPIKFKNYVCDVNLGRYGNGRLAIQLTSAVHDAKHDIYLGSPIATATVNIPEATITENHIIIKEHSENEGMLKALQDAGLIGAPIAKIGSGFVEFPIVEKTEKLIALENEQLGVRPKRKM